MWRRDLERMDEQLKPHINKLIGINNVDKDRANLSTSQNSSDWELDPAKLTIKCIIGQGAYGSVYRGLYDGQHVAVKILSDSSRPDLEREFQQEVSVWYHLDHPNIAKLIGATSRLSEVKKKSKGVKVPNNGYCIVVEYVPGGTLKSYLRKRFKKIPLSVVIQFAIDVAKGLSYLHSRKIVHRDVKTENLLLDKEKRVKFIDFGVSRLEAINKNEMTAYTGTVGYMAPEVFDGKAYDHTCDVFSFGICLWEIYYCAFPCPQQNPNMSFRPEVPNSCPDELANVMKMCWENSKNRPEMIKVVEMLEAFRTSKVNDSNSPNISQGCFGLIPKIFTPIKKQSL